MPESRRPGSYRAEHRNFVTLAQAVAQYLGHEILCKAKDEVIFLAALAILEGFLEPPPLDLITDVLALGAIKLATYIRSEMGC